MKGLILTVLAALSLTAAIAPAAKALRQRPAAQCLPVAPIGQHGSQPWPTGKGGGRLL